jgi:transcriptional regulator with PAS, ATPase and Fis domain
LNKYNLKFAKDHYFTAEALDILSHHNWPGNVRELEHLVERVVVTAPSPAIGPESLPVSVLPAENLAPDWSPQQAQNLDQALEQVEKTLVQKAKQAHGSSYKVAKALGISQSKAYRLIQKHCTGQPS